ncbi:MAG: IS3 family transposase [Bacilli bacterium]|nr:IS3 family transposase [Bacilli bacterium]
MANKGQKLKSYSDELRKEIVNKYLNGMAGRSSLSKDYDVPLKTINNWLCKYNHGYDLISKNSLKGRRKNENIDYKERYEILKKIPSLPKGTTREKVTFINLYINKYKLSNMCAVLEISKRTYYKYRKAEDLDYYDYLIVKEIFDDSKGTYGYRRITEGVKIKYGVIFNHKKVRRIMTKYYIKPEYIRKLRPNITYKRIEGNVKPNLLNRKFNVDKENSIWCTDITYLIFNNKRAYLSTIIDLYDRKVVSYKISKFNDNRLVLDTLNEALGKRKNVSGLIIHSDQGFQYTSLNTKLYVNLTTYRFL